MSMQKKQVLLAFLFICSLQTFAQKGLYAGLLFNTAYAHNKSVPLPDNSPLKGEYIYSQIENNAGFGFFLRFGINNNFSLSAGGNYSRRTYAGSILKKTTASVDTIRYNYFDFPILLNYRILLTEGPKLGMYLLTNAGVTITNIHSSRAVLAGSATFSPSTGSPLPAYTLTFSALDNYMSFTAGIGMEVDLFQYGVGSLGVQFRKFTQGLINTSIDYQNANLADESFSLGDIGILNVSIKYAFPLLFTKRKTSSKAKPRARDE